MRSPGRLARMPRHHIAATMALALLTGLVSLPCMSPTAAAAPPTLRIVSPADGAVIANGSAVFVAFEVTDFNLTRPGTGGPPTANEGYVVVFVDDLVHGSASVPTIELALASGPHAIRLQLVATDGSPLDPDVTASVRVTVTRGPTGGPPTIEITSPTEGSSRGTDVAVSFRIMRFALVPPGGPADVPNEGHILVFVDDVFYRNLIVYEPVHLSLDAGTRRVTLQLVDGEGRPLEPDVSATVRFTVVPQFGRATSYSFAITTANALLGLAILGVLILHRRKGRP